MKVLLIGNYGYPFQGSMQRFGNLMLHGLQDAGVDVRMLRPEPNLGRLRLTESGVGKWLGYVDRFLLFRMELRRHIDWADVVHICDHSNSVYIPWLRSKPHVVTCHDILAIRSALGNIPEHRTRWSGRVYQKWILGRLQMAQSIVCVSQQTAEDVLGMGVISKDNVSIVLNSLNFPFRPMTEVESSECLARLLATDSEPPFFLHVGGNSWYKNRPGVLNIYRQLIKRPELANHHLVMVGREFSPEINAMVHGFDNASHIHSLVGINNEDLMALYSSAQALIFPSLYEGFGWPVLEAQACGCPVFASNRKPLPEVAGKGAHYFDPTDILSAADTIAKGLSDTPTMKRDGLENANLYSLKSMTGGYIEAYKNVLAERLQHPKSQ